MFRHLTLETSYSKTHDSCRLELSYNRKYKYKYIWFLKVISLIVQQKCKNEYKIKLSPCLFKHHTMKVHKGVKITHSRPIHYLQVSRSALHHGHQRQSGYFNDEKHFLPMLEIKPQFLSRPVRSQVTIPISLSQLKY